MQLTDREQLECLGVMRLISRCVWMSGLENLLGLVSKVAG